MRAKEQATSSEGMVGNDGSNEESDEEMDLDDEKPAPADSETLDEEMPLANLDVAEEFYEETVSYESLSLGLGFSDFFGDGYDSILVRKEYRDMRKHISDLREHGKRRGVIVTGTPGIGENMVNHCKPWRHLCL